MAHQLIWPVKTAIQPADSDRSNRAAALKFHKVSQLAMRIISIKIYDKTS